MARSTGLVAALIMLVAPASRGPAEAPAPTPAPTSFQVTIFGIEARPGETGVDPKLASIAEPLRKLRPNNGFTYRGHKSVRLSPGESVRCDLGDGLVAEAQLKSGPNEAGKVVIQFTLWRGDRARFTTKVTTPLNQLFFCEKPLGPRDRLLIGVGAR